MIIRRLLRDLYAMKRVYIVHVPTLDRMLISTNRPPVQDLHVLIPY